MNLFPLCFFPAYVVRLSEGEYLLKESANSVKPTEESNADTVEFLCGAGRAACLQEDEGVEGMRPFLVFSSLIWCLKLICILVSYRY